MTDSRARQDQSRSARARHEARRLSRAAHGLSGAGAARHDRMHSARGPVCDRMRRGRRSARSLESGVARRRRAVALAAARRPGPRRARPHPEAHSAAGRSRRRQHRRGRDAARPDARLARAGSSESARGRGRRRSAPTSRSFCRAARRSGSAAATRSIRSPICRVTGSCCSCRASASRRPMPTAGTTPNAASARGSTAREVQHVPGPWPSRAAQMINDLEAPIARHHPEIDQMKTALRRAGALAAAMSGSGSTVFGLFQQRSRGGGGREPALGLGLARADDRVARPRRVRAETERRAATARSTPCREREVSTTLRVCAAVGERLLRGGAWPSGKARDFGSRIRRFESSRPNQNDETTTQW